MKKISTETSIRLALAGLVCLLAGFAPTPEPFVPVVRGSLPARLEDSRLPLSSPVRDAAELALPRPGKRSLDWNSEPVSSFSGLPASSSALLHVEERGVSVLTKDGPQAIRLSGEEKNFFSRHPDKGGSPSMYGGERPLAAPLEMALSSGGYGAVPGDRHVAAAGGPICSMPFSLGPRESFSFGTMPPGFQALPMLERAVRYREAVERYASRYNLDPALVYAIMQTESGFNPTLISSRQAHGLMQVVPTTAGDEVHRWFGQSGLPTTRELLNPDNNIRYGTAYLHLLHTRHLEGVRDPQSREYCVIAAYNGGSGAVLRHFGSTREAAFAAINRMSPSEVLEHLTRNFPARETRTFVSKVLNTRDQFVAHAGKARSSETGRAPAPLPESTLRAEESDVEEQLEKLRQLPVPQQPGQSERAARGRRFS